jgi:hypothetical protein
MITDLYKVTDKMAKLDDPIEIIDSEGIISKYFFTYDEKWNKLNDFMNKELIKRQEATQCKYCKITTPSSWDYCPKCGKQLMKP